MGVVKRGCAICANPQPRDRTVFADEVFFGYTCAASLLDGNSLEILSILLRGFDLTGHSHLYFWFVLDPSCRALIGLSWTLHACSKFEVTLCILASICLKAGSNPGQAADHHFYFCFHLLLGV